MNGTILRRVFVFLLAASSLFAQNTGNAAVQIVTYWEPGDSHSYALEMGTQMSLLAGDSRSFTSYRVLIEVLERSEEGYLIQWTYSEAVPPPGANAFERQVVATSEGLSVRYFISDLGEFIGVENFKEIATRVGGAMAAIRDRFAGEPDIDTSVAAIMRAFDSKESFERLAIDEIKLYHMLHGYTYLMDDPLIADGEVENPFGGAPILARTTIELSEVDGKNSTAYLIYRRSFDRASLHRAVFEALNGYLPEGELTPEQTADLPDFDIRIKKQFIFHTASGWLLEAYSERHSETTGEKRADSIYIEFLE